MGTSDSTVGRFVMGKNVVVMAILLPVALVAGVIALASGGEDAAIPFIVAGLCLLGAVLGVVFLGRSGR
jgi:hypothetical protein